MLTLTTAVACGPSSATRPPGPSVTFARPSTSAPTAPDTGPVDTGPVDTGPVVPTTDVTTRPDPTVGLIEVGVFEEPVDLAGRQGDETLFVVERAGRILPVRGGVVGAPALDIGSLTSTDSERGLLGLAFSTSGATAFVHHTDRNGANTIAAYDVSADGVFDPASRRVLVTIDQPYPNHNGGGVAIGPDGMLYISVGDGGAAGDPLRASLDVSSPLGKLLRIDPGPDGSRASSVPPDNPFVQVTGAAPEVWAVGLRNPWRFSFDSATGDLWIADVGQDVWEEVNLARRADGGGRGWNFGWSAYEGAARFNDDQPTDGATPPVYQYAHADGACSISGGVVARDPALAELDGWYVFGDYCSSTVTALDITAAGTVRAVVPIATAESLESVVAVREGPGRGVYVLSLAGTVWRIAER